MALVTKNIEDILELFGESITLHHVIHENPIIYESKESTFWANVCLKFFAVIYINQNNFNDII